MAQEVVFVAMSFREEYRSVYDNAIVQACEKLNLIPYRADEYQISSEPRIGKMVEMLHNCKLFIADISGYSPNVFYEIGYLQALGKKGFFISQLKENPPYDIHDYAVIRCNPGPKNLEKLIEKLRAEIEKLC